MFERGTSALINHARNLLDGDDVDNEDEDVDEQDAEPPLTTAMDLIEDVAGQIGSGNYVRISALLKKAHRNHERLEKQRALDSDTQDIATAIEMVAQCPQAINTRLCCKYVGDDHFIKAVVLRKHKEMKSLYEKGQPRLRTLLSTKWLEAIVREMLDVEASISGATFHKIRHCLRALFVMRLGVLPLVIRRLDALRLTPKTLFAHYFCEPPIEGDDGKGPTPMQIVGHEPRMLRWFLGLPETAPYPKLDPSCEQIVPFGSPGHTLILKAHIFGGDDPLVNWPCTCVRCNHPGLPVMPNNARQANFEKIYRAVNQWPISVFADASGVDFGSKEPLNRADARDFDVMGLRCRDPENGGGEWWHRTRNGKRKAEEDREDPWGLLSDPMSSDLHTMPSDRSAPVRVSESKD